MPTSNFLPIRLLDSSCSYKFKYLMTQCRSRSVGFFRSQLIWIYTVCKDRVYPSSAGQGLIGCSALNHLRQPILTDFYKACERSLSNDQIDENLVQLVLDPSRLLLVSHTIQSSSETDLDRQSKSLCQSLHLEWYKRLSQVPTLRMNRGNGKYKPQHTKS